MRMEYFMKRKSEMTERSPAEPVYTRRRMMPTCPPLSYPPADIPADFQDLNRRPPNPAEGQVTQLPLQVVPSKSS